jgi:hypothetical protein
MYLTDYGKSIIKPFEELCRERKVEIEENGIGLVADEYIYTLEELAAYWLYVHEENSLKMVDFYEAEDETEWAFYSPASHYTYDELRQILKICLIKKGE